MAITRLQKTGYYVTTDDGGMYADSEGHIWFTKNIARDIARELGTWYDKGSPKTIKTVVTVRS